MEPLEAGFAGASAAEAETAPELSVEYLRESLEEKARKWIQEEPEDRLLFPKRSFKEMQGAHLPQGASLSYRPIKGRRVSVRARPAGMQVITGRWPASQLEVKPFSMLAIIIRGSADLQLNNYLLRCHEGTFLFIPGDIPHPSGTNPHLSGDLESSGSCDILWISRLGDNLKVWICRSEPGKHSGLPSVYLKRNDLCNYCEALFEGTEDNGLLRARMRQGLIITLIAAIQHEIQLGRYFRWLPQAGGEIPEEDTDPVKRGQKYIQQHLSEPLIMEAVARHCLMSRSNFARLFRIQTGETFNQYVTRCRLEEAKLRLTTTTAPVNGIARHVGLKPRHFNDLIRHHTGLTPGAYRKQHRDEANSW